LIYGFEELLLFDFLGWTLMMILFVVWKWFNFDEDNFFSRLYEDWWRSMNVMLKMMKEMKDEDEEMGEN